MLMQIDATFAFVVVSFLIFLFIIKKILYLPITRIINERENFYIKNSKMEASSKEKSKTLLLEKEERLKQARKQALIEQNETLDFEKNQSADKIHSVKNDMKLILEKKQQELQEEAQNAKNEIKGKIRGELENIVSKIVSEVLGENAKVSLDDNILERHLRV